MPGKDNPDKGGNHDEEAAAATPPAVLLAAIVPAAPVAAQCSSTTGNAVTPNDGNSPTVSSSHVTSVSSGPASNDVKDPSQALNEGRPGTYNLRLASTGEKQVAVPAASQNEALSNPNPTAGIPNGETPQVSAGSLRTEAAQENGSPEPSESKTATTEAGSHLQSPPRAKDVVTARKSSFLAPGLVATWGDTDAAIPSSLSKGSIEAAGVDLHAPSPQYAAEQSVPQGFPSGSEASMQGRTARGVESSVSAQSSTGFQAQVSTPSRQPRDAFGANPIELAATSSMSLKSAASQDKNSRVASTINAATPGISSTLQPTPRTQGFETGGGSSPLTPRSGPTREQSDANSPGSLRMGLQAAGVETQAASETVTALSEPKESFQWSQSQGAPGGGEHSGRTTSPAPGEQRC